VSSLAGVELGRLARHRLVAVIAALLVIGGVVGLVDAPSVDRAPSISTVYYYADGAYHLLALVHGPGGAPLAGVTVDFSSPQALEPGSTLSAVTSTSGVVNGTFPSPTGNFTYIATASTSDGTATTTTVVTNWPFPVANGTVKGGLADLAPVDTGTYEATGALLAFYAASNGSVPSGYQLEVAFQSPTESDSEELPLKEVGTMSGYSLVIPAAALTPPPGSWQDVWVSLWTPAHTRTAIAVFPPSDFGPQAIATPAADALNLALTELGLLLATLGPMTVLFVYGAGRVAGAHDLLIARSITPRRLVLAEFGALALLLGAALAVSVGGLDVGLARLYGAALPWGTLAVVLGGLVAALAAWTAVGLAFAHRLRTPVGLVSTTLLTLVLAAFVYTPVLAALGDRVAASSGGTAAGQLQLWGSLLNPALAPGSEALLALGGTGAMTGWAAVAIALLWVFLPLGDALRASDRSA
jgi:hypothetical protein